MAHRCVGIFLQDLESKSRLGGGHSFAFSLQYSTMQKIKFNGLDTSKDTAEAELLPFSHLISHLQPFHLEKVRSKETPEDWPKDLFQCNPHILLQMHYP